MHGCRGKLCLDAEVKLVQSGRPKMLAAYSHKLHKFAERVMVLNGYNQMLRQYRFELDEANQILLAESLRPKMIIAYGRRLCPQAEDILRQNSRLARVYEREVKFKK